MGRCIAIQRKLKDKGVLLFSISITKVKRKQKSERIFVLWNSQDNLMKDKLQFCHLFHDHFQRIIRLLGSSPWQGTSMEIAKVKQVISPRVKTYERIISSSEIELDERISRIERNLSYQWRTRERDLLGDSMDMLYKIMGNILQTIKGKISLI